MRGRGERGEGGRGGGYLVGLRGAVLSGRDQLGGVARVVEDGGDVDGGGDVGGGRGGGEDVVGVDGAGSERGRGGGVGHCCGGCGMRGEMSARAIALCSGAGVWRRGRGSAGTQICRGPLVRTPVQSAGKKQIVTPLAVTPVVTQTPSSG